MNINLENNLFIKKRAKRLNPFFYSLNKIKPEDWLIFGSLTWKDEYRRSDSRGAQRFRDADFNRLLNEFSKKAKIRRKKLAFYKTTEYGMADERHVHFLIAKVNLEGLSPEWCASVLEGLWKASMKPFERNELGVGSAVIRPYDAAYGERGVNYCLKREYDEFYQLREPDDFLSNPLKKLILAMDSKQPDISLN